MIENVHQRLVRAEPARVGELLERLAGVDSPLWPVDRWPALLLDRPLAVGATGGHGPVGYTCTAHEPGRRVEFAFAPGVGLRGTHSLTVLDGPEPGTCLLRHDLRATTYGAGRLAWPLAVRWLHDALLEDLLDRAETAVGTPRAKPARWSPWVRFLYWKETSKAAARR